MPPVGRQSAIANGTANKKFLTETGLLMEVITVKSDTSLEVTETQQNGLVMQFFLFANQTLQLF